MGFSYNNHLKKPPEILHIHLATQTRQFSVEQVALRFSNGAEVDYERLSGTGRGAVLVMPILNTDALLMIREYCVGTERYELGFVKGKIDADEAPADTVQRELREEIGYGADNVKHLKTVSLTPGYSSYQTHLFLATGLFEEKLQGDEPEELEIVRWPLSDLMKLLKQDDFSDARSQLAVYLLNDHLKMKR